jgi:hypothetical protein
LFDETLRDKLLFEDPAFTYSRRYFWAYQTLGLIQDSIKAIVLAYRDNSTDQVWDGRHKTFWPIIDTSDPWMKQRTKRMAALKMKFEAEIHRLERMIKSIEEMRKNVRELREQLFSGTSVMDSLDSMRTSVHQRNNIQTMAWASFLPIT